MHEFDYKETPRKLLTPEVVNMLLFASGTVKEP